MPRQYVDNAMNRSLGRVGMAHGTAVHSRSSGGGGGSSYSSGSFGGQYVDNAMNRSLGRVGMDYGTAVHSRSSGGGGGSSYASGSSGGQYVDNAFNRSLGRVGMDYGTAVHSRSSGGGGTTVHSSSASSGGNSLSFYVDNDLNRRLGRVGLEKGTAVVSKSSGSVQSPKKVYVDNAYNRQLGRVGMPLGSFVQSKTTSSNAPKLYVDNAANRRLGRAGKPLGSMPVSKANRPTFKDFNQNYEAICFNDFVGFDDNCREEYENLRNLKRAKADKLPVEKKLQLKPQQIINFSDLSLGDKIGTGGFGDVHVGIWKGNQVAIKKLRVQRVSQAKKKQFEDEVFSFSKLDHPYIVKFYGACVETPNLAIIMEFLPDGSLYDNLHIEEIQFEDSQKHQFICDAFSALAYLHSKSMVHRDIKSKNIMLCDNKTHCKLVDFGLVLKDETAANSTTTVHGFAGTEKYCANEVLEGQKLSVTQLKIADVYSLALTSVELLTEKEPFDGLNIHQIRKAKSNGDMPSLAGFSIPASMQDLLKISLSKSVEIRPTAQKFLDDFNKAMTDASKYYSCSSA